MGDTFKYLVQGNTVYGLGSRTQSLELGRRHKIVSLIGMKLTDGRTMTEMVCESPAAAKTLRELLHGLGMDAGDMDQDILVALPGLMAAPVNSPDEDSGEPAAPRERICRVCHGKKGPLVKKPGRGRWPVMCE